MSHNCKKGTGTPPDYKDRCYHFYNGECLRGEKESCFYNLGKKKKPNRFNP